MEYIYRREPMQLLSPESILSLPNERALSAAQAWSSAKPSEIECEVMNLFEQFRNPFCAMCFRLVYRYMTREEVIQEVFLALFRHLAIAALAKKPSWLDLSRCA